MQNIATNSISYFFSTTIIYTLVAIVFVIFVDTISITDISSQAITDVSTILFEYSHKNFCRDSNYNLLCMCDNFCTHIDMLHYTIESAFTIK